MQSSRSTHRRLGGVIDDMFDPHVHLTHDKSSVSARRRGVLDFSEKVSVNTRWGRPLKLKSTQSIIFQTVEDTSMICKNEKRRTPSLSQFLLYPPRHLPHHRFKDTHVIRHVTYLAGTTAMWMTSPSAEYQAASLRPSREKTIYNHSERAGDKR